MAAAFQLAARSALAAAPVATPCAFLGSTSRFVAPSASSGRISMMAQRPVNAQVEFLEGEDAERAINRFIREVKSSGVIYEVRRRRFHENSQDEKKRRLTNNQRRTARERRANRNKNQDFYGSTMPLIGEVRPPRPERFQRRGGPEMGFNASARSDVPPDNDAGFLDVQYLPELREAQR